MTASANNVCLWQLTLELSCDAHLLYRNIPVCDEDVDNLRKLTTTPLSYILDITGPQLTTQFGDAPIGSALSYQVGRKLTNQQMNYILTANSHKMHVQLYTTEFPVQKSRLDICISES